MVGQASRAIVAPIVHRPFTGGVGKYPPARSVVCLRLFVYPFSLSLHLTKKTTRRREIPQKYSLQTFRPLRLTRSYFGSDTIIY